MFIIRLYGRFNIKIEIKIHKSNPKHFSYAKP